MKIPARYDEAHVISDASWRRRRRRRRRSSLIITRTTYRAGDMANPT